MRTVILCSVFGVIAQCYFFGFGTLIQILLASISAIIFEAIIVKLRKRPVVPYLRDNTALLTGVLIVYSF